VIAFLFPGQGSQRSHLLADSARAFDAYDLFAEASDIVGFDVMLYDDDVALQRAEVVQRNIFLAGIAGARALERGGVNAAVVAGHSVGAFAAATVAGVLDLAEALRLVEVRAKAMARSFALGYAMGAVLGATERDVSAITALDELRSLVYVAVVNAADQIVVAGTANAVDRALEIAKERGARDVRVIRVTVPSHTPFMAPVRSALAAAFEGVHLRPSLVPVSANVDGRALVRGDEIANDLVESVARTVRWLDVTQTLLERGVDCFVEAFLGDTLTRLAEETFPETLALSLGRMPVPSALTLASKYEE
jgi:malonate decarboxylase epsilon subunit